MTEQAESLYYAASRIAEVEYADIVEFVEITAGKLRLHLTDGSYVDIWFSRRIAGRYAYHWERRWIDGAIYRYDNRPHEDLRRMKGFPKHFHDGNDGNVVEMDLGDEPRASVRKFLELVRSRMTTTR